MVYHFARNLFISTQRAELTFNGVIMSDIHKKEVLFCIAIYVILSKLINNYFKQLNNDYQCKKF